LLNIGGGAEWLSVGLGSCSGSNDLTVPNTFGNIAGENLPWI
jgi:hypothetical protein